MFAARAVAVALLLVVVVAAVVGPAGLVAGQMQGVTAGYAAQVAVSGGAGWTNVTNAEGASDGQSASWLALARPATTATLSLAGPSIPAGSAYPLAGGSLPPTTPLSAIEVTVRLAIIAGATAYVDSATLLDGSGAPIAASTGDACGASNTLASCALPQDALGDVTLTFTPHGLTVGDVALAAFGVQLAVRRPSGGANNVRDVLVDSATFAVTYPYFSTTAAATTAAATTAPTTAASSTTAAGSTTTAAPATSTTGAATTAGGGGTSTTATGLAPPPPSSLTPTFPPSSPSSPPPPSSSSSSEDEGSSSDDGATVGGVPVWLVVGLAVLACLLCVAIVAMAWRLGKGRRGTKGSGGGGGDGDGGDGDGGSSSSDNDVPLSAVRESLEARGRESGGAKGGDSWGLVWEQNPDHRRTMEDAHVVFTNFTGDKSSLFVGVYDGHGGTRTAELLGERLHTLVKTRLRADKQGRVEPARSVAAMRLAYEDMDAELVEEDDALQGSGATSVTALIVRETGKGAAKGGGRVLHIANCGDARAVLCRNRTAERLSVDHKAQDEAERIEEAGGLVMQGKLNGTLAVSRAFGDLELKPVLVSEPFTNRVALEDGDRFLIVACDGLWDVVDDQEAVDICLALRDREPADIAAELLQKSLDAGTRDNVSIAVVKLEEAAAMPLAPAGDTSSSDSDSDSDSSSRAGAAKADSSDSSSSDSSGSSSSEGEVIVVEDVVVEDVVENDASSADSDVPSFTDSSSSSSSSSSSD